MTITPLGLLIGGTASIAMITSVIFGIYFIYKSRKMNANLLLYSGFLIICTGCFYLGAFTDFMFVIFFGTNIPVQELHGLLSFSSVAPAVLCAMYLGSSLIMPSKKKIVTGIYLVIGIFFEIILYSRSGIAIEYDIGPNNTGIPGSDLLDSRFNTQDPTFFLIIFFLVSALLFCGIGFAIKYRQSSGELRKRFLYLDAGFIVFVICAALDTLIAPGPVLILIRLGMIGYAVLVYLGLKPT